MFRFLTYVPGALFWVSGMHGFHLDPSLKPLLDKETNTLTIRSDLPKHGLVKVRIVDVVNRDKRGTPLEFQERLYYECAKCEKEKKSCSCSMQSLPSLADFGSLSPVRNLGDTDESMRLSPLRASEGSPLLSPILQRSPVKPNRLMQALATCISLPQLLCALCSESDDDSVNACYDEHVSPYILPETESGDLYRGCLFPFCPCCMPQEEM